MSTPNPNASSPAKPSTAGRYLFLFLLGLVVGVIAVVMLMRTWESRKTAHDHWPSSAMYLLDVHFDQLRDNVKQNRCAATDTLPQLQSLRVVANDLEPAFGDLREDARFTRHASTLRATLDAALASPPLNCPGVQAAVKNIGEACKGCHQDFRS